MSSISLWYTNPTDAYLEERIVNAGVRTERLTIVGCEKLSDLGLSLIAFMGPHLKELRISGIRDSYTWIFVIFNKCVNLKVLAVESLGFTGIFVDRICSYGSKLEKLELTIKRELPKEFFGERDEVLTLTDRSLEYFSNSLIELKELNLKGFGHITPEGLDALRKLPKLSRFKFQPYP